MLWIVKQLVIQSGGSVNKRELNLGLDMELNIAAQLNEYTTTDEKEEKWNSFNDTRSWSCWRQKQPNEWKWDSIKEDSTHVVGCNIDPAGIEESEGTADKIGLTPLDAGSASEDDLIDVGPCERLLFMEIRPPIDGVDDEKRQREQHSREAVDFRDAVEDVALRQSRHSCKQFQNLIHSTENWSWNEILLRRRRKDSLAVKQ
jgi:hypothetical protein